MERHPTLLLVEDEDRLRALVAEFLRRARYQVDEAADGCAAVERYCGSGPYDLVVMDLDLPGLPGLEAVRRIRAFDPSQPIVITSAAILAERREALESDGGIVFLTKPYLPGELLHRLREVLAREKPRAGRSSLAAALAMTPLFE